MADIALFSTTDSQFSRDIWRFFMEQEQNDQGLCAAQADDLRKQHEANVFEIMTRISFYYRHGRDVENRDDANRAVNEMNQELSGQEIIERWRQHLANGGDSPLQMANTMRMVGNSAYGIADLYELLDKELGQALTYGQIAHTLQQGAMNRSAARSTAPTHNLVAQIGSQHSG